MKQYIVLHRTSQGERFASLPLTEDNLRSLHNLFVMSLIQTDVNGTLHYWCQSARA